MTAYAIYFSPTRTSERIARAIARGTGADEVIDVDLTHDARRVTLPASALAVIAIPVYGGHLPPLAAERLRGLQGSGTPAVAVVVYGNRAYENALTELAALAGAAGLNVIAAPRSSASTLTAPTVGLSPQAVPMPTTSPWPQSSAAESPASCKTQPAAGVPTR